jgi:hypothetical protein
VSMAGTSDLPVDLWGRPLGLSVAAHLRSSGVPFPIFWYADVSLADAHAGGHVSEVRMGRLGPSRSGRALHAAAILRRGRAILQKYGNTSRYVQQILNVISARSALK